MFFLYADVCITPCLWLYLTTLLSNIPIRIAEDFNPRLIFTLQQPILPGLSPTIAQQLPYPTWSDFHTCCNLLGPPHLFLCVCVWKLLFILQDTAQIFPPPWSLPDFLSHSYSMRAHSSLKWISVELWRSSFTAHASTYGNPLLSAGSLPGSSYPWSATVWKY